MKFTAHETLSTAELYEMLQAGVDGTISRGRAQPGDKTMIDAWTPALAAYEEAMNDGADTIACLEAAVKAAEQGMKDTIPMQAKKGRASYLGERSIGHQDPGATSSFLILQALLDVVSAG
jgi:dihydroxyacetone kinase-like protein